MHMEPRYAELEEAWLRGERGRDESLDLMFHAWMHWADPSCVSGLRDDSDALRIWHEIFDHFGGTRSSDVEFLYVAQIMVALFPWALGDEGRWGGIAAALERQLRTSDASHLSVQMFEERGEYGKYFAHQLRSMPPNTSLERTREG